MKKYNTICTGGTFDLLHTGHKSFLKQIFDRGERLIIGLTSDKYIHEHKSGKNISTFESRKKNLESFLKEDRVEERVQIISIDDLYGPLLGLALQVDAIAVTSHSSENAKKINNEREKLGLSALEIIEIPLVRDKDGEVISSSKIRRDLLLPSTLRPLLQDTWGEILDDIPDNIDPNKVITVGDVTTGKFIEKKIFPKIAIIDNKVERKDKKFEFNVPREYQILEVKNPAGTISKQLSHEILKQVQDDGKGIIIVDGEEDLAVLPALLHAPVGFEIYYGQPGVGLAQIEVTEENRKKAQDLVDRFEIV